MIDRSRRDFTPSAFPLKRKKCWKFVTWSLSRPAVLISSQWLQLVPWFSRTNQQRHIISNQVIRISAFWLFYNWIQSATVKCDSWKFPSNTLVAMQLQSLQARSRLGSQFWQYLLENTCCEKPHRKSIQRYTLKHFNYLTPSWNKQKSTSVVENTFTKATLAGGPANAGKQPLTRASAQPSLILHTSTLSKYL